MNTVRAQSGSARALKTLTLVAFVWGAAWVALDQSGPAAIAVGQEAGATAAPAPEPALTPAPATTPEPAPPAATEAAEDAAARMYVQKCAGCHTVGRGKLTGPDLNVAATWPVPDLSRAIKSMEPKVGPLSEADLELLAGLLKDPAVKERIETEQGRAARAAAATLEPPSAEIGAGLFSGRVPLANGGAACVACHAVDGRGGNLGPDLTGVYQKLGEVPLASACEKANFKIMSAAYRDHPVTRQEALHLTKFLAAAGAAGAARPEPPVGAYGAAAAAAALGAIVIAYRGRSSGARRKLMRRRHDVVD